MLDIFAQDTALAEQAHALRARQPCVLVALPQVACPVSDRHRDAAAVGALVAPVALS